MASWTNEDKSDSEITWNNTLLTWNTATMTWNALSFWLDQVKH